MEVLPIPIVLWFEGSRDDRRKADGCEKREMPVFREGCTALLKSL